MNKLKLLVTASLLVGGGLFALSAADGVTSAKAAITNHYEVVTNGALQDGWKVIDSSSVYSGSTKYYGIYGGNNIEKSDFMTLGTNNCINVFYDISTYGTKNNMDLFEMEVYLIDLNNNPISNVLSFVPLESGNQKVFEGTLFFNDDIISNYDSIGCNIIFKSNKDSTDKIFTRIYNANFDILETANTIFDLNYNEQKYDTIITLLGENIKFPDDPIREGYRFEGWFTEPTGGEKITSLIASENTTLYAHWSESNNFSYLTTKTSLNIQYGIEDALEQKEIVFSELFDDSFEPINNDSPTFDFSEVFGLSKYIEFIGDLGDASTGPRIYEGKDFRTYKGNSITLKPKENIIITGAKLINGSNVKEFELKEDGTLVFNSTNSSTQKFTKFEFTAQIKNINIADTSIRFGATLDAEKYYVEGATYGVVISAGTTSFDETLNKSNDYETFKINLPQSHFEEITPVYVNDENDLEESETGKYIQFAAVITGLLEHKDMELTAAAYRVVDGTIELMHEKTYSVVSLAKEYISRSEELALTDEHITILNSIVGE